MRMLLKENAQLNTKNADKTRRLQKEYKDLHDRSRELKDGYDILLEEKEYSKNRTAMISARVNSKTYSCSFRKASYQCLENQVPVEATSRVISGSITRELVQYEVDFLHEKSTISQFAQDLGVISDLQVGEVLERNDNLTLGWDATSIFCRQRDSYETRGQ